MQETESNKSKLVSIFKGVVLPLALVLVSELMYRQSLTESTLEDAP